MFCYYFLVECDEILLLKHKNSRKANKRINLWPKLIKNKTQINHLPLHFAKLSLVTVFMHTIKPFQEIKLQSFRYFQSKNESLRGKFESFPISEAIKLTSIKFQSYLCWKKTTATKLFLSVISILNFNKRTNFNNRTSPDLFIWFNNYRYYPKTCQIYWMQWVSEDVILPYLGEFFFHTQILLIITHKAVSYFLYC